MGNLENRYKRVDSDADQPQPERRGKQPAARKPVFRSQQPEQPAEQPKMTYDDYVEHVDSIEKIIDIDERSRWRQAVDTSDDYKEWLGGKWALIKGRLKTSAGTVRAKQPTVTEFFQGLKRRFLDPLESRFGVRNIRFGALTTVLLLVMMVIARNTFFSGGAATVTETEVLGSNATEPTFEVAKPDVLPEEQPVFFDPTLGAVSYNHEIEGTPVVISQQPLTDEQKANRANELGRIAITLSADASFESKFGRTYISNPILSGGSDASQVIIFMTEELLIFIRNDGAVLDAQPIADYIERIQV